MSRWLVTFLLLLILSNRIYYGFINTIFTSFIHSTHNLIHSFIHSFLHSFIHSFIPLHYCTTAHYYTTAHYCTLLLLVKFKQTRRWINVGTKWVSPIIRNCIITLFRKKILKYFSIIKTFLVIRQIILVLYFVFAF